jgi:hypothetical protein
MSLTNKNRPEYEIRVDSCLTVYVLWPRLTGKYKPPDYDGGRFYVEGTPGLPMMRGSEK